MEYGHPIPWVLTGGQPTARALLRGGEANPGLVGEVLFYPYQEGSLLLARVAGLPGDGFYGFHLHALGDCGSGGDVAFHCAGDHFDPQGRPHPQHAGDFPVLLSSGGQALSLFYTGRFRPQEAVGRAVIVHAGPDDYRSQPSGDSGARIACGVVERL